MYRSGPYGQHGQYRYGQSNKRQRVTIIATPRPRQFQRPTNPINRANGTNGTKPTRPIKRTRADWSFSSSHLTSIQSILQFIPFTQLIKCTYVCKGWFTVINQADFLNLYFINVLRLKNFINISEFTYSKQELIQLWQWKIIKHVFKRFGIRQNDKKEDKMDKLYENLTQENGKERQLHKLLLIKLNAHKKQLRGEISSKCRNCHVGTDIYSTYGYRYDSEFTSMCRACRDLTEFKEISVEKALRTYGITEADFLRFGIRTVRMRFHSLSSRGSVNEYVVIKISKWKYGQDFNGRTNSEIAALVTKTSQEAKDPMQDANYLREMIFGEKNGYASDIKEAIQQSINDELFINARK